MKAVLTDYLISLLIIFLSVSCLYIWSEIERLSEKDSFSAFLSASASKQQSKSGKRYKGEYQVASVWQNPLASDFWLDSTIWAESNMNKHYRRKPRDHERIFLKDSICDGYIVHAENLFRKVDSKNQFSKIFWLSGEDTLGHGRDQYNAQIIASLADTLVLLRMKYESVYQGEIWLVKE